MGHGFCMTLPSTRKRFHGFSLMDVMIVAKKMMINMDGEGDDDECEDDVVDAGAEYAIKRDEH